MQRRLLPPRANEALPVRVLAEGAPGAQPTHPAAPAGGGSGRDEAPASRAPRVILNRDAVWALLDQLGISQHELARRCGLSSGYFSQLMSGAKSPSARVRRRLQQVLGVGDFDRLFIIERADEDGP